MTVQMLEARRMEAAKLFESGMSASRVGRELGVSAQAAWVWRQKWEQHGAEGLRRTGHRGRRPSLGPEELCALEDALVRGPRVQGYLTDVWTLPRIATLIQKQFAVHLSCSQVWRVLRKLGWTCQKPARRAKERDEQRIAAWVKEEWPRVKGGQ